MSVKEFEFQEVKFYEYTIRMTNIDNIDMYLVTDIIKQYNEINKTNKRINDYFRRKDTQELLQFYRDNSRCGNFRTGNFVEDFNNFGDIPGVIMKIDYSVNNNITNKAFIVNSNILHDILMWIDKVFAHKVRNFLENMRSINNDRFTEILNANKDQEKQISLLQDQIKEYEQQIKEYKEENKHLKTRSTPDNMNYHFTVIHNIENNHVSTFISKKQYNPSDKNIKRIYDLVCPNPSAMQELTINLLSQHKRFQQIDNNEFITNMSEKGLSMQMKKLLKQVRESLDWITGLKV